MRVRNAPIVVALVALGPVAALLAAGQSGLMLDMKVHFWGLVVTSGIAAASAFTLSVAGARRRDGRVVLMGTAFAAMATLLFVHGFATPGVLAAPNGVIAMAGAGVLPVGGMVLAIATLPRMRRTQSVRGLLIGEALLVGAIVALGAVGLIFPDSLPSLPKPGSALAISALVVGLIAFSPVLLRAARTYVLTRRIADLAVVAGVTWLAVALAPQMLLDYTKLAWWMGHVLEFAGIALAGAPVALDLHRAKASRPLLGDLRAAEMVAAEEAYLGSRVRSLVTLLERKDPSTEEHTRRVSLLAVGVGEDLGLNAAVLRDLAIGGLLHDMGKLSVPDEILMKPAALDDEEFAVIRKHPDWGHDLLVELGGFSEEVRSLVRDHHERLDGKGYPRGLRAYELALPTRILAVCDVYDALVSDRVYREAWPAERALALLRSEAGVAYDSECVEALARVVATPLTTDVSFVADVVPAPARVRARVVSALMAGGVTAIIAVSLALAAAAGGGPGAASAAASAGDSMEGMHHASASGYSEAAEAAEAAEYGAASGAAGKTW